MDAPRPLAPPAAPSYAATRERLHAYFDRTAAAAWERLTSDAPVSRIRRTVREGRETMRAALLARLPESMAGMRVLDAGCGPGDLAQAMARRGAEVVGVDLSASLLDVARRRLDPDLAALVRFERGDMLAERGRFDAVVAMDSLIHYRPRDAARMAAGLAARADRSVAFTFAPRTPALAAMHAAGRLFPRGDRAPAVEPVAPAKLLELLASLPDLGGWRPGREKRVSRGFYISQAMELVSP